MSVVAEGTPLSSQIDVIDQADSAVVPIHVEDSATSFDENGAAKKQQVVLLESTRAAGEMIELLRGIDAKLGALLEHHRGFV